MTTKNDRDQTGMPASFKVGMSKVCITPELPCEMAGYFHSRIARQVNRDLYAYALALENNAGQRVLILSVDLVGITDSICMPVFEASSKEWQMPIENLVACATHTHTGPEIREGSVISHDPVYIERLRVYLAEAITKAMGQLSEAVLFAGQSPAPGLAHNRLSRCADGSEIFGDQSDGQRVIGPAGPEDTGVQTLGVYGIDKALRGVAVNFACHPDLAGGGGAEAIDADWPGEMAEILGAVYGTEVPCALWQGTAGDINHADHRNSLPRWLPGGRAMVARGVAGAAMVAMETAAPLTADVLACRSRLLDIPFYTRDQTLFELADRLRAKGDKATYFEQNLIKRIDGWTFDGKTDQMRVTCIRIGELAIVVLPGEIFTAWGLEIKRFSPAKHTFVLELANSPGLAGYKPTSDQALRGALARGAYGALPTLSQRHHPASGQMLCDTAISLLHELWP